ncbi:post-transcriptional regulator [Oceanobacillus sp. CFH 90083]|uniref:post-transcriptional regulator n=1 Tax=Oceanobacillus sp. CFH 90083 TaxID=2592336 RepID=UPI00128DB614|nr:post-transcriptional regulator [Oceanobacillus sp. CFH 90083]
MESQYVDAWKEMVYPALKSKQEELEMLGYEQATPEDVWRCLSVKVWNRKSEKRLHEIVQDIFHLKSSVYLSYLTIQSYENDDLAASIEALIGNSPNTGK